MRNTPPRSRVLETASDLLVDDLEKWAAGWLLAGEIEQHSVRTTGNRREIVKRLLWFLRDRGHETCGVDELRAYLAYLSRGHLEAGGRWGVPYLTKPVSPRTVHTHHNHLRTLFRWLAAEGMIDASPMERIPAPISRDDQIEPFTPEQCRALLDAARRTRNARRDYALALFLLDTGARASEVVGMQQKAIDLTGRRARLLGKGNKERTVGFSARTGKALFDYSRERTDTGGPAFRGERGPMTRSGLLQWAERLGVAAGIEGVHPHRFRHTFAVSFLRAGGETFALQQLLGHTSLTMTMKYVAFARADIERQAHQHSPVDRLFGKE